MNKQMNEGYAFKNSYGLADCFTLIVLQSLALCLQHM